MPDITNNGESTRSGLSEAGRLELIETAKRYPLKRSAVLHGLRLVQQEAGFVTEAGMRDVAALLEMTPHEVYDVATFYTMFYLRPKGEYLIQVCRTLPCALGGSESLLSHLEQRLGIRPGETTPDGKFTLVTVECLAACGKAPVMQVNDRYHEAVTAEQVDRLIDQWRRTSDVGTRAADISESGRLADSAARTDAAPSSSEHAPSDLPAGRQVPPAPHATHEIPSAAGDLSHPKPVRGRDGQSHG
jgi:NADH-quinone oxidoreductase E subunit